LGANAGKAITDVPSAANIAKARRDFDHFGLLAVCRLIPLRMGITSPTTIVSGRSDITAYICEQSIVLNP
jgi:hypothetical protein